MRKLLSIVLFACFTVLMAMGVDEAVSILKAPNTVYAATSKKESEKKTTKRKQLVKCAKKYKKTRYVWGGTNLKRGVDCSGFVQQIYKKQGYRLPRTSREQARKGKKVSKAHMKQGDLLFYGSSRRISHVAIYIGNGLIIHASNPRDGVKISKYNYRNPVAIRRIIL